MKTIDKLAFFPEISGFSHPKIKAIAVLVLGVLTFSCAPVLVKLGESEISPTAVMFDRFLLATVIFGLWNVWLKMRDKFGKARAKNPPAYTPRTLGLLLGGSICFAATQLLWAWSLTQTSIANSSLLHNFTPLFVTIGGWLLFARNFNRSFIIGTSVTIIGSIVLGLDDIVYEIDNINGDFIALLSAFFFAIYFLLLEEVRNFFTLESLIFCYCTMGTIAIVPFLAIGQDLA